jgi:lipoprotein-releasing system ATP-binding protein
MVLKSSTIQLTSGSSMTQLEVSKLSKEYPTPAEPLQILADLDLSLSAGENLAIVGPSGSGKSTLLHILGTLDTPTSGSVALDGTDPFALGDSELAKYRNENIGFVFQEHYLLPQLTVLENVLVPTLAQGNLSEAETERARQLLERVGLSDRLTHRPGELSGGERQRVAVARSLIMDPVLLLADEPTGSLDYSNAASVAELLIELQTTDQRMLVVVTHSAEIASLLQKQHVLEAGRLGATT